MAENDFSRANRLLRNGEFEKAITIYIRLVERDPDFSPYRDNLAYARQSLKAARAATLSSVHKAEVAQTTLRSGSVRRAAEPAGRDGLESGGELPEALRVLYEAKPRDEESLMREYEEKGLAQVPDTFVLYRIIGNDLYPRHARGQHRANIRFILENEPKLEGCEKRWIVNRIEHPGERAAILDLLDKHDQTWLEIPFKAEEFARIGWDFAAMPASGYLSSSEFFQLGLLQQERAHTALYRLKNMYLMNNNGARNAALEEGRRVAKWVLPWDGNCFVTASAWASIREAVVRSPHLKYFVVPMQRMTDNQSLLRDDFVPSPVEEPQILFRKDAAEGFDENHPYGRRPKVALFWRLQIPGQWDKWKDDPWEQARPPVSREAGQFGTAGWVARLSSGVSDLESTDIASFKNRGRVRQQAIRAAINHVQRTYCGRPDPLELSSLRFEALEAAREEYARNGTRGERGRLLQTLLEAAEAALKRTPGSVTDKPEPGPSGDLQDYYHPAPYWWPNPDTVDNLPYIKRDGKRVPGTRMYEPESDRYDRTRLQYLFDDCITLTLAAFVTDEERYSGHAARWIERWFLNPGTRMNPHLIYAQVRRGHNGDQGSNHGIIEMKDVYYFLDAVRLLVHSGRLSPKQLQSLREWFSSYLDWLLTSAQGVKECQTKNNHGTYYDLQVAAIAAFLDDHDTLFRTLARAQERIVEQISPEGKQPEEMSRTNTAHYCCFNLQGWLNLAELARRYGIDLVTHRGPNGASLQSAFDWMGRHLDREWPYEQIEEFDRERFVPLFMSAKALGFDTSGFEAAIRGSGKVQKNRALFHPHDGIRPFWNLDIFANGRVDVREMSERLLHVLVMRFGIGIFDETWLEHRFGLMSAITIPSLRRQTWPENSRLLIQVDAMISDAWMIRLTDLVSGLPVTFQKLLLHSDRREGLSLFCNEQKTHATTHILTSRMDDDDALSIGALDEIRDEAMKCIERGSHICALALKRVIRYLADENCAIEQDVEKPEACGASVLLRAGDYRNIYNWRHLELVESFKAEGEFVFIERGKVLYTMHRMSDTNYGARRRHILKREDKFYMGAEQLRSFGIDERLLGQWRVVDARTRSLGPEKTSAMIGKIEQEIRREQRRLEKEAEGDPRRLQELLEQRRALGSNVSRILMDA